MESRVEYNNTRRVMSNDLVRRIRESISEHWDFGKEILEALDSRRTLVASHLDEIAEANGLRATTREFLKSVDEGGDTLDKFIKKVRRAVLWADLAEEVRHCKIDK